MTHLGDDPAPTPWAVGHPFGRGLWDAEGHPFGMVAQPADAERIVAAVNIVAGPLGFFALWLGLEDG